MSWSNFLTGLPQVKGPTEKKLPFKVKLKWTLIILVAFFVLSEIPLFGLGQNSLAQFEYLSIILGAKFGAILSLGIGPIVTASIVLQLLSGSGIIKLDTTTHEGRTHFQGLQKILTVIFVIFESLIYVLMGGLAPSPLLERGTFVFIQFFLVAQLCIGGLLVLFMDEIVSKWGFGSGVSLFIAAGVASQVFIRAFSPLTTVGKLAFGTGEAPIGKVWVLFQSLLSGNPTGATLALFAILATIIIFFLAVYSQAMKVEVPLSFERIRGYGIRWPLKFIYTSNIPVILVAALIANIQLWARLMQSWAQNSASSVINFISTNIIGQYSGNSPVGNGLIAYLYSPQIPELLITHSLTTFNILQAVVFTLFMMGGAVLFSVFWVQTSGMNAQNQAKQIMASGFQIPGFRRDERVLQRLLERYISPLTVMGALTVGFLAASADLLGALTSGTGLLLTVMIIYNLYENIAQQHMMDMYPALRKMIKNA